MAAADRDGGVAEGDLQVGVTDRAVAVAVAVADRGAGARRVLTGGVGVVVGVVDGGQGDAGGDRVADGCGAELGEGGQGGVPAGPVPAADLGLVPSRTRPSPS